MTAQRTKFPQYLNSIRSLMPELLDILEKDRKDRWYSFIWFEESTTIVSMASITESATESTDRGIVFRILLNGRSYEKATNNLDKTSLISLAKKFRLELDQQYKANKLKTFSPLSWEEENIENLSQDLKEQLITELSPSTQVHFGPVCKEDPFDTSIERLKILANKTRLSLLKESKAHIKANSHYNELADIRVMAQQKLTIQIFVDREKNMSQTLPVSILAAAGTTVTGQMARTLSGGLGGFEILNFDEEAKEEVSLRPQQLAKAKRLTPGRYQIISGPEVSGVIAHEAFGHTQEGDTWMKGRSIATNLFESKTKVGNDQASIVNHPNLFSRDIYTHGTNGSYFFDHEGQLARKQIILDKGMLSNPMTDLTSALALDVPRTANGKRECFRRPLMSRQTNTYFTPGDKTLDELIGMVKFGYLARWAYGGMEDPKGGSLTAGTSYFEEIKDGQLTGEILQGPSGGHIELSDPVFTILNSILAKTKTSNPENIPDTKVGGCGKYHKEGVSAGCGGPYILWDSINCG